MRICVMTILAAMGLSACSTVAGVGKDVSAVGAGVTHVANEVREEVFMKRDQSRYQETQYNSRSDTHPSVIVKEPCDPNAGELRGGPSLPPCPKVYYRD